MHDAVGGGSDQQQPHVGVVGSDPKVLVATTVAALLLVGSAYIWRSGASNVRPQHDSHGSIVSDTSPRRDAVGKGRDVVDVRSLAPAAGDNGTKHQAGRKAAEGEGVDEMGHDAAGRSTHHQQQEAGVASTSGTGSKHTRAKERRRRGKETKDIIKIIKSGKGLNLNSIGKAKLDEDCPSTSTSAGTAQQSSQDAYKSPPSHPHVSLETQGKALPSGQQFHQPEGVLAPSTRGSPPPAAPIPARFESLDVTASSSKDASSPMPSTSYQYYSRSSSKSPSRSGTRPPVQPSTAENPYSPLPRPNSLQSPQNVAFSSSNSSNPHSDSASTASSSSTATEATSSTTPSSLPSPAGYNQVDIDRPSDSDSTPKIERDRKPSKSSIPPPNRKSRRSSATGDPWNWDGAGESNRVPSNDGTVVGQPTKPQRFQHQGKHVSGSGSSTEVSSVGTPHRYASVVSNSTKASTSSGSSLSTDDGDDGRQRAKEDHDFGTKAEEEQVHPLTFPSLNNPAPESSSASSSGHLSSSSLSRPHSSASSSSAASSSLKVPGPSRSGVTGSVLSSITPLTCTPPVSSSGALRRAPTPRDASGRRPSTPAAGSSASASLSGSMNPSSPSSVSSPAFMGSGSTVTLSAQTQLASLRGALEAARLREEKSKSEIERVSKEFDMLRWENVAWRRREGELQAQIQHMMHQMQAYAVMFSSMSQHSQPSHSQPMSAQPFQPPSVAGAPSANSSSEAAIPVSTDPSASDPLEYPGVPDTSNDVDYTPTSVEEEADPAYIDSESPATDRHEDDDGNASGSGPSISTSVPSDAPSASPNGAGTTLPPLPLGSTPPLIPAPALPQQPSSSHAHQLPIGAFPTYPLHPHQVGPQGQPMPISIPFPFQVPSPFMHLGQQQGVQQPGLHQMPFSFNPGVFQMPHSPMHPGMMMAGGMSSFSGPASPLGSASSPQSVFHPSTPNLGSHAMPGFHQYNGSAGAAMGMAMNAMMMGASSSPLLANGILSGPPPNGGPSSVGSMSPDLTGSPSPVPVLMQDRGRRRGKGRARGRGPMTAQEVLGRTHEELDVWPSSSSSAGKRKSMTTPEGDEDSFGDGDRGRIMDSGEVDVDDEEEGEFNELLADAILKRPSSIRMGSKKGTKDNSPRMGGGSLSLAGIWDGSGSGGADAKAAEDGPRSADDVDADEEEEQREFTFPSLSDLGNVIREKRFSGHVSSPGEGQSEGKSSVPPTPLLQPAPEEEEEPVLTSVGDDLQPPGSIVDDDDTPSPPTLNEGSVLPAEVVALEP